MFRSSYITKRIAYLSVLVGMSYVLKSFLSFELTVFRFTFYDLPLFLTGMFFGPLYGLLAGFIVDTLHIATPNNLAVGYNLLTVTSMMWGFVGGLFFYRKRVLSMKLLIAVIVLTSILEFTINSVQLYGPQAYGFFQFSPIPGVFFRIGTTIIKWPIQVYFVIVMFHRVLMQNDVYLSNSEDLDEAG